MVPDGWRSTTFDKHIECTTGFAFKSSDYSANDSDIKLLRGDNIEPGKLRWKNAKYWPANALHELDKYRLLEGDFVIAMDRTWVSAGLKVAEVTSDDLPCLLVQRIARIRAKNTLEQALLRQYFSGHRFEQHVKSVQTATAVPHISPNDIRDFPFYIPPTAEQKKIAQILSTWDEAITTTEQLLANSQQQKKALMQQLLTGKRRLPGFTAAWTSGYLSDLASIRKGKALSSRSLIPGRYDVIAGGKSSPYTHAEYTHENAITVSASGAYAGFVAYHGSKIWASDCSVVEALDKNSIGFIFEAMRLKQLRIYSLQSGGAQPHIYPQDLSKLQVEYPQAEEQEAISLVLSKANREIKLIEKQLVSLKGEKKALMQQLLTGKRRVTIDEAVA